ncbi:hypothetical protein KR032_007711 [Drosophila birchii]|nr:hypothetical protein KR032_007711 [Drosophila birchii]
MSRTSRSHMFEFDISTISAQTDDNKIAERNFNLSRCLAENAQLKEELIHSVAVVRSMYKTIARVAADQRKTLKGLEDIHGILEKRNAARAYTFASSRSFKVPDLSIFWSFLRWAREGVAMVVSIASQWMNFLLFDQAHRLNNERI